MNRSFAYRFMSLLLGLLFVVVSSLRADDNDVLDRIIYLSKAKGTVYSLLGTVSEKSGYLFIYDSKVVNNERSVKLNSGSRTVRQAVYEIIGNDKAKLRIVGSHILIYQPEEVLAVVVPKVDTLAYFTLEGTLLDKQSGAPIAYGTVGVVGNSIGSISNQEGGFRLRLPDSLRQSRLGLSHIGYEAQEVDISLLTGRRTILSLEPRIIPIQEVIVRATNPVRLLREMLERRDENYAQTPVNLTTFYREGIQYKQKFRSLTEAVFRIYKASSQNTLLSDQVKLLKMSRITNNHERDTLIAKMTSGIDACLQLDLIKQLPDFLMPDASGNVYNYASSDVTVIDDRLANVVSFEQKRGVIDPLYRGELYIDSENSALLQARFEVHPNFTGKATEMFVERKARGLKLTTQKVAYTISYKQWNGKYYVSHIRGDLFFKVRSKHRWFGSSTLHTWFEMVTCKIDTENVVRFQRRDRMPTRTVFADTHFKYDPDFWGEFNVIPWEQELGKVIDELSSKIEKIEY